MDKALMLLVLMLASAAQAQTARDPTQPPALLLQEHASTAEREDSAAQQPVLGAVVRLHDGRSWVVINGQVYRQGDQIGDQKITRIEETGVLLRGPQGNEMLVLSPELKRGSPTRE